MPAEGWKKAPDGTWTPPNVKTHKIDIEEDTQEFLEEMMNKWIAGKAIRASGHALQGLLGNPAMGLWLGAGIIAALATLAGKELLDTIISYFKSVEIVVDPGSTKAEKDAAANQMIIDLRALIESLSPLGGLTPVPVPPPPPPPSGGGGGGGGSG